MAKLIEYLKNRDCYVRNTKHLDCNLEIDLKKIIGVSEDELDVIINMLPKNVNQAKDIVPYIQDVINEGSTSIVYKIVYNNRAYALKIKKNYSTDFFFENDIYVKSNYSYIHGITPLLFGSIKKGVCVTEWIDGSLMKNIHNPVNELQSLITLTSNLFLYGLYDDDFTPSNIIFTDDNAFLVDVGEVFLYDMNKQSNPFQKGYNYMNMYRRFLYKNFMVYLIRLMRYKDYNSAFTIYIYGIGLLLSELKNVMKRINNALACCLYELLDEIENGFLTDIKSMFLMHRYISCYLIIHENINDNYKDENFNVRICELINLIYSNYDKLKSLCVDLTNDFEISKKACIEKYYSQLIFEMHQSPYS